MKLPIGTLLLVAAFRASPAIADEGVAAYIACEDAIHRMQTLCKPDIYNSGPVVAMNCGQATNDVKSICDSGGRAVACHGAVGRVQVWCNSANIPIGMDGAYGATICGEANADAQNLCRPSQ